MSKSSPRKRLSRDLVLAKAVEVADAEGLKAMSMRRLGRELGVEAMSLYNHVKNKEDVLDGLVDVIMDEIGRPAPELPWSEALEQLAQRARAVYLKHPWSLTLVGSRKHPGLATIRYHDAVLGCLRRGGFTVAAAAHAFSLLDAYIYGFVMQEKALPFQDEEELLDVADGIQADMPSGVFPHLEEMMNEHVLLPGYNFSDEFDIGLGIVLSGLEQLRNAG